MRKQSVCMHVKAQAHNNWSKNSLYLSIEDVNIMSYLVCIYDGKWLINTPVVSVHKDTVLDNTNHQKLHVFGL